MGRCPPHLNDSRPASGEENEIYMNGHAWFALWLIALAPAPALADDFVPDDVIASDPSGDLSPPEFDQRTKRMIWQDRVNKLWVANVDVVTGAINPIDGRGTLVDTGLSPGYEIKNTPRYAWGAGQGAIVYNKTIDGIRTLAKAVEVAPNTWETSLLENGEDRWKANGSPEETTDPARIVYNRETPEGTTVVSWRDLDDPASEQSANVLTQGGRFFGAEPSVIVTNKDEFGVIQIYSIPFSTGNLEQVSFGSDNNFNAFIWFAPEYQQYLIVSMVRFAELAIYRQVDGVWTKINQFTIPSAKPLLSSPEGFVANGKSYITVVACDELGASGFVGQPVGPSEIWLAGIDPDAPFFRRIDDPSYEAQRSEPEPFLLDNGPVVYYTELASPRRLLKRAATGLAMD